MGFEVSESGGQEVSESEGQGVSESVGFEVSESEGLEVSESDAKVSESGGEGVSESEGLGVSESDAEVSESDVGHPRRSFMCWIRSREASSARPGKDGKGLAPLQLEGTQLQAPHLLLFLAFRFLVL